VLTISMRPRSSAITRPDGDGADGDPVKRASRRRRLVHIRDRDHHARERERAVRVSEPAPLPDGFFGVNASASDAAFRHGAALEPRPP